MLSVAYEDQRRATRLLQNFPLKSTVYVPIGKVPQTFACGTVTGADDYGVHVEVRHPTRQNKLAYIVAPAQLRKSL